MFIIKLLLDLVMGMVKILMGMIDVLFGIFGAGSK